MRTIKIVGALTGLALVAALGTGCLQIVKLASISLGNLSAVTGAASAGKYVDLASENSTYRDHRDKFDRVNEVAVLGTFRNNLASPVSADVWIVPAPANAALLPNLAAVQAAGGIKAWSMALRANETRQVTWNQSVSYFTQPGQQALQAELEGDALFTLYVFGSTSTYDVTATNAEVAVTLIVDSGIF